MPDGYLVQLGDASLDAGDSIVDPLVSFTTQESLGNGNWVWTGTYNGSQYTNEQEPGEFVLATDGNIYFVPAYGPVSTLSSSSVISAPDALLGTSGNDTGLSGDGADEALFGLDGDDTISGAGGVDTIYGGAGADDLDGGSGNDVITGGSGADTIDGGSGSDTIYGDNSPASTSEFLHWEDEGNNSNVASGFTQNTGFVDVTVSISNDGALDAALIDSTTTQYTEGGDPFDTSSSLEVEGTGGADTATVSVDFNAAAGADVSDTVANVTFRLNDIDTGSWIDVITVNAFDADGNPVTVVLTPENTSNTTSDNTVTAGVANGGPDDASGSILVTIAGPVSSFDIIYENDSTGGQRMWVSDIHFDTVPNPDGDDILSGGTGADDIFGGGGNDTISVADGDDAFGEDGDDTFILTDLGETNSAITIDGGEGGETGGDTIQLGGLAGLDDVTYDVGNPESGTITLTDGTVVTFSNIENIICFTPGAMISTPFGPRPVETLQAGDLVLTRDAGPQPIRWIGQRTVAATGDFAPVSIAGAALPHATAPLLVSPQHRMLFTGYRAELLFGEREVFVAAKHLVDGRDVTFQPQAQVTYIHLMFDTHQIIEANGEPTESLHIGDETLAALSPGSREEVFTLFPQLRSHHGFPTARRALRRYEAALL